MAARERDIDEHVGVSTQSRLGDKESQHITGGVALCRDGRMRGVDHIYGIRVLWVLLNCYSRMYLGVHYPLDILAGLVVGTVMAWVVWRLGRGYLFPLDDHGRRCGGE